MKTPPPSAAIKWTDEEWSKIANWLHQDKGGLLASDNLEEIKARDVFLAQEVLPEDRHRKLISIAQGFQGIRARLRGLFEKMRQEHQEDLFPGQAPRQEAAGSDAAMEAAPGGADAATDTDTVGHAPPPFATNEAETGADQASLPESDDAASPPEQGNAVHGAEQDDAAPAAAASPAAESPRAAVNPANPPMPFGMSVPAPTAEAPQAAVPASSRPPLFPESAEAAVPQQKDQDRQDRAEREAAMQPGQAEQGAQPASGLIEMARPFVAMVCEEFARALVRALAEQGGAPGLLSAMQPGMGRGNGQVQRPPRNQQGPRGDDRRAAPPEAAPAARQGSPAPMESFDEDASHPLEVQPLFDPKLPPSANSDFKPMIGLVATRAHEYEDLQMLYPQLQLSIVQADAIRGPDAFRNCQRIIGLRDEVPQATDDLLKRTLRHRYVRINGGMERVREQLNSWLDKPGTIAGGPRPPGPRNEKRPGAGNGKKRHKWPPRVER